MLSQRNHRPWCAAASAAGASDFISTLVAQLCHSLFAGCLNHELKALTSAWISVPPKPGHVAPCPRACSSFPSVILSLPESRLAAIPAALLPALEKSSSVPVLSHSLYPYLTYLSFLYKVVWKRQERKRDDGSEGCWLLIKNICRTVDNSSKSRLCSAGKVCFSMQVSVTW